MDFIGEHSLIGEIGHFLILLSFVSSLVSMGAYFFATIYNKDKGFLLIGRGAFVVQAISIFSIVGILFYMMLNGYYEYHYVWKYANSTMTLKYLFASFWSGQEGSFLLWIFWQSVLGWILIRTSKNWEAHVMTTFSFVQLFLISMLLGVYIGDFRLGSNPFILQRELPKFIGLPWTTKLDYLELEFFKDGQGLNPLLRNYWMTIHPPTLFLGFALTLVPFAYAIAGIWRKMFWEWIKPALSWTFVGIGVLGLGILMGGAWAYESLSFGGFWAWDPVENAVYIPWLVMVGGAHVMLANRNNGKSVYSSLMLMMFTFILILYSTFLTRSGVLGTTSVHSFTGDGMLAQLLHGLLFFIGLSIIMLLNNNRLRITFLGFVVLLYIFGSMTSLSEVIEIVNTSFISFKLTPIFIITILSIFISLVFLIFGYNYTFPKPKTEEKLWSKEFWLFAGALVLTLGAIITLYFTSHPVVNMITGNKYKPYNGQDEAISFYNQNQGVVAILVLLIMAVGQYLKYKDTRLNYLRKKILPSFIIAISATVISLLLFRDRSSIINNALIFASFFAIAINVDYFIRMFKGKWKKAGSAIAHIGFGLIIFGAVVTNSQGITISQNDISKSDIRFFSKDFDNFEDIKIYLNDTVLMKDYFVSFNDKKRERYNIYYNVDYFEIKNENGKAYPGDKLFSLKPFIQINEQFGNAAEPGTKHFLGYDIFTHIRYADTSTYQDDEYLPYEFKEARERDSFALSDVLIVVDKIEEVPKSTFAQINVDTNKDFAVVKTTFSIQDIQHLDREPFQREAYTLFDNGRLVQTTDAGIAAMNFKLQVTAYSPAFDSIQMKRLEEMNGDLELGKAKIQYRTTEKEFIIMQAKTFPLINVLWLGCIVMFVGTIVAAADRMKKS